MENELKIKHRLDAQNRGDFYIDRDGELMGRMNIEIGDGKIFVYHTEVAEELRGTNAAKRLLEAMVDHARQSNLRIVPYCPYVYGQFRRHPEKYEDVWFKDTGIYRG